MPEQHTHQLTLEERFWAHVDVVGECWVWMGSTNSKGYGDFYTTEGRFVAHRFAWKTQRGPIPDGLQLDHLCRNPPCVRMDHLEPVTPRTNVMRGNGLCAQNARKVTCLRGHALDGVTRCNGRNERYCKTCHRARQAERYQRTKDVYGPIANARKRGKRIVRKRALAEAIRDG